MYDILLTIHNLLRWVVLIAALAAVIGAWRGTLGKRSFERGDRLRGLIFTISLDVQLLLGLLLYAVSPLVRSGLQNMGAAMKDPSIRYFIVEHATIMILAVIFVHIGTVMSKRAGDDQTKHRRSAIWYTLALLTVFGGIPWPFFQWGRPLFPW